MGHFHHVVLFQVHAEADPDEVVAVLNASRPTEGLVSWVVERSLDERKGPVVAELAVFTSAGAFRSWRDGELHRTSATRLREIADWLVADWEA